MRAAAAPKPVAQKFVDRAQTYHDTFQQKLSAIDTATTPEAKGDAISTTRAALTTLRDYAKKHVDKRYAAANPNTTTIYSLKHSAKKDYKSAFGAFADSQRQPLLDQIKRSRQELDETKLTGAKQASEKIESIAPHAKRMEKNFVFLRPELSEASTQLTAVKELGSTLQQTVNTGDLSKLATVKARAEQLLAKDGEIPEDAKHIRAGNLETLQRDAAHVELMQDADTAVKVYSSEVNTRGRADDTRARRLVDRLSTAETQIRPTASLASKLRTELDQAPHTIERSRNALDETTQFWRNQGFDGVPRSADESVFNVAPSYEVRRDSFSEKLPAQPQAAQTASNAEGNNA